MGAILQTVKHHQCYTIYLYSFAVVVEYHKGLSMWADYYVCVLFSHYLNVWTEYLNELKISRNVEHAFTHHWIVCITCCMIASPSMFIISGAWKSTTSQTGVANLQPTELVDDCCLQSSNQKYVSQFDISQLTTHMEAILTDFRFYTSYFDILISKYFYLS